MRTVNDVLRNLPITEGAPLPAPSYTPTPPGNARVGMAVESMKRHMTDEGWQLFAGLECNGYTLAGHNLPINETDTRRILYFGKPSTVVLQDKREWLGLTAGGPEGFNMKEKFTEVDCLKERKDIFKLTILKDAQHNRPFHRQSAEEIGCNGWIVYYNKKIVKHLAPYVREEHLIRTYHSFDSNFVPVYSTDRSGVLLSGAASDVYPMRRMLINRLYMMPKTSYLNHPGYHRNGCCTPEFLKTLSGYKVAICTSSIYGYTLRKIIEATACGCMVLTDLPVDEVLPFGIDDNLVRVDPNTTPKIVSRILSHMLETYNPERQKFLSDTTRLWYDYRAVGKRLAYDIETLRLCYGGTL